MASTCTRWGVEKSDIIWDIADINLHTVEVSYHNFNGSLKNEPKLIAFILK